MQPHPLDPTVRKYRPPVHPNLCPLIAARAARHRSRRGVALGIAGARDASSTLPQCRIPAPPARIHFPRRRPASSHAVVPAASAARGHRPAPSLAFPAALRLCYRAVSRCSKAKGIASAATVPRRGVPARWGLGIAGATTVPRQEVFQFHEAMKDPWHILQKSMPLLAPICNDMAVTVYCCQVFDGK